MMANCGKMGIGVGIMMLRDGKVLLGKRSDDPEKADSDLHGEGTWTMPGGKLEFGESLEEAAIREVLEETGIRISEQSLEFISVANDVGKDAHFITIGFLCRQFNGEPVVKEPEEITEWKWFEFDSLPGRLFVPSSEVLENYMRKVVYRRSDT